MRIAFFVSSIGDTDLALKTIKVLESYDQQENLVICLTETAWDQVKKSQLLPCTLPDILEAKSDFSRRLLDTEELAKVRAYIKGQQIDYAYFGVPSEDNPIPFQLAESLDIPVLMAYEFMFRPENHCLWKYVPALGSRPNVQWAIPLASAKVDFPVPENNLFITGHLSIDNAFLSKPLESKTPEEIKNALGMENNQPFTFASSTTQPVETDAVFLDCFLQELKNHKNMQVRLGLHPGIRNMDEYLETILGIYKKHPEISSQFRIVLPEIIIKKIQSPELTIDNPDYTHVFLKVNINGSEAASAADRVSQAVPGALINQAVFEGKPTYIHSGAYLPPLFFSKISSFFTDERQPARMKKDFDLDEKTTPENYASIIMGSSR